MQELTKQLARLSRIDVSGEEAEWLAAELEKHIEYLSVLDELPPEPVKTGGAAVLREDIARPSMERAALFANTPNHDNEYFILPGYGPK